MKKEESVEESKKEKLGREKEVEEIKKERNEKANK